MKWASALSERKTADGAMRRTTAASLQRQLATPSPISLVVFASPHHADAFEALPARHRRRLPARAPVRLLGAPASSAPGTRSRSGRRSRSPPPSLPGVRLRALVVRRRARRRSRRRRATAWRAAAARRRRRRRSQFLLSAIPSPSTPTRSSPASTPPIPTGRKVGGIASGGSVAGAERAVVGRARRSAAAPSAWP